MKSELNNAYKYQFIWKFPAHRIVQKIRDDILSDDESTDGLFFKSEFTETPIDTFYTRPINPDLDLLVEIACLKDLQETYRQANAFRVAIKFGIRTKLNTTEKTVDFVGRFYQKGNVQR